MQLIENDPFQLYWNMSPIMILYVTAFLGTGMLWLIELYRSFNNRHKKDRPPWGLAVFRWRAVCIGDLFFLPAACLFIAEYYARVRVEPSFWTSQAFFSIPLAFGLVVSAGFILLEEATGSYPKGKKVSLNRVYHFFYFWWMSYMLSGFAIRWLVYWEEPRFFAYAVAAVCFWAYTVYEDGAKPNPVWIKITQRYPRRTEYR